MIHQEEETFSASTAQSFLRGFGLKFMIENLQLFSELSDSAPKASYFEQRRTDLADQEDDLSTGFYVATKRPETMKKKASKLSLGFTGWLLLNLHVRVEK